MALTPAFGAEEKLEKAPPNILFIFADDYAYDCLGAAGNERVETPNLDRLAKKGTHFTRAYNPGGWGGAVCVASRTMMQMGKQIWTSHRTIETEMIKQQQFFPQIMQQAGYETYFSGKWHVQSNKFCEQTWKNTLHIRPGMPNQTSKRYKRNFTPAKDDWSPSDKKYAGFWRGGKHWSEVLADDGLEMIEQASKQQKPFMMMLCFNAPHDPRQAPQSYQDKYPYSTIPVPESFQPEYPYDIGSNKIRDEQLAPFPRTPYSVQVNRSEYYALISHMDTQIGRILDGLEKSGKADNTIVIFSADHGLACGHHGLIGKQNVYEHSMRVPWIIAGPGIPTSKKIDTPIYLQDAMATCIDLAGTKKPAHVEFNSVLPLLKGGTRENLVYGCYAGFQRMLIEGDYKLIVYPHIKKTLLFNLKTDPHEMKDLAVDPQFAEKVNSLTKKLVEQMEKYQDPLRLDDPVTSYQGYKGVTRKARNRKHAESLK